MEFDKNKDNETRKQIISEIGPYVSLGFQIMVTILLGLFVGWKLDEYLNTKPIFIAICTFLFAALALTKFITDVLKAEKKGKKQ